MSENIKVAIRVRPFAEREHNEKCALDAPSDKSLIISESDPLKEFQFNHIFWSCPTEKTSGNLTNTTQQSLYEVIGADIVKNALLGYNSCLFAYGQTGSGKSYSLLGDKNDPGVLHRLTEDLINTLEAEKLKDASYEYKTTLSFLEIHNEKISDLFNKNQVLEIREHKKHGVFIPFLTEVQTTQLSLLQQHIQNGMKYRTVGQTQMNQDSSRSHAVFTLKVHQKKLVNNSIWRSSCSIHIVDLAGSERQKKSETMGERLKEGGYINYSLHNLGLVISRLVEKERGENTFIPFRNSKLTFLLREALSGNSKTYLLATVSPGMGSLEETLSTLRFAQLCANVCTTARKNQSVEESLLKALKEEVMKLKQQLMDKEKKGKSEEGEQRKSGLDVDGEERIRALLNEMNEKEESLIMYKEHYDEINTMANDVVQWRGEIKKACSMDNATLMKLIDIDNDCPLLINLSEDPYNIIPYYYFLFPGMPMTVGSKEGSMMELPGSDISPDMCRIYYDVIERQILLSPLNVSDRILINGLTVGTSIVQLHHYDKVFFGRGYQFRVIFPHELAQLKKAKENAVQIEQKMEIGLSLNEKEEGREIEDNTQEFVLDSQEEKIIKEMDKSEREGEVTVPENVGRSKTLEKIFPLDSIEYNRGKDFFAELKNRFGYFSAELFLLSYLRVKRLVDLVNELMKKIPFCKKYYFSVETMTDISLFDKDIPQILVRAWREKTPLEKFRDAVSKMKTPIIFHSISQLLYNRGRSHSENRCSLKYFSELQLKALYNWLVAIEFDFEKREDAQSRGKGLQITISREEELEEQKQNNIQDEIYYIMEGDTGEKVVNINSNILYQDLKKQKQLVLQYEAQTKEQEEKIQKMQEIIQQKTGENARLIQTLNSMLSTVNTSPSLSTSTAQSPSPTLNVVPPLFPNFSKIITPPPLVSPLLQTPTSVTKESAVKLKSPSSKKGRSSEHYNKVITSIFDDMNSVYEKMDQLNSPRSH